MSASFYHKITWAYALSMTVLSAVLLGLLYLHYLEGSAQKSNIGLRSGDAAPILQSAKTVLGTSMNISYPPSDGAHWTVLSLLSSKCPHCLASIDVLNRFAIQNPRARVVGIAVDSVRSWRDRALDRTLRFPLIVVSRDQLDSFQLRAVPATVVVDNAGTIREILMGALQSEDLATILPGVDAAGTFR